MHVRPIDLIAFRVWQVTVCYFKLMGDSTIYFMELDDVSHCNCPLVMSGRGLTPVNCTIDRLASSGLRCQSSKNPNATPRRMTIVKPPNLLSIVCVGKIAGGTSDAQLEALLMNDRERNLWTGTTGALLICDGEFMHCLEGAEQCVRPAFELVRAGPERLDIVELMNQPIGKRALEKWHMGVARASGSELLRASTAHWEKQYLWSQGWKVPRSLELLRLFWSRGSSGGVACTSAVRESPSRHPTPALGSPPICVS
jgi:hypothetical protein